MPEEKANSKEEIEVFPFIEGKTIDLVAGNSKWADLYCKWDNDPNVRRHARNTWPLTTEEVKKWFEPSPDRHMKEFVAFTIYHKRDQRPIGFVGLERINWVNKNANISATIGEPDYWGKGIAVEACKLLIKYGFTELNLHKIYASVHSLNARSLRATEKLGFQKEGIIKEEEYVDGQYLDEYKFALFKRDWIKSNQNES